MRLFAAFLCSSVLIAQSPVRVEYACPGEDVESFGLTCSEEHPCPVFLELSSVESAGSRIFTAGNLHTATTTLYGVLLSSEDGGTTWAEPFKRLRAAAFEQIQFVDPDYGWVSGQQLEPLPRDPFFLLTTDGGKLWQRRPIFEEARYGAISQFWFESRSAGEFVFDRSQGGTVKQELYGTMTGGESWEIKQTSSTALRLAKARSKDNTAWRVRADATSKTYRVEHRAASSGGEKWETVASFPIHVGDCK